MNASLLAVLNDAERLLVAQTERAELAALDEDAAIDLEARIRRARNKYVGQYRRSASARVVDHAGRGTARAENKRAAMKAEAFEEALARVSRRVATLARQAAAALRAERLAAARAARHGHAPGTGPAEPAVGRKGPSVTGATGDRALRSPRTEKRAGTLASGAPNGRSETAGEKLAVYVRRSVRAGGDTLTRGRWRAGRGGRRR
jgi:hypothetical protein